MQQPSSLPGHGSVSGAVASLPARPRVDLVVVENELREALRAARKDVDELMAYVLAVRPLEPVRRDRLYELRIGAQQKFEAVRWRVAADLVASRAGDRLTPDALQRLAVIARELTGECDAIERDATKAWSHILAIFTAVPPLP